MLGGVSIRDTGVHVTLLTGQAPSGSSARPHPLGFLGLHVSAAKLIAKDVI